MDRQERAFLPNLSQSAVSKSSARPVYEKVVFRFWLDNRCEDDPLSTPRMSTANARKSTAQPHRPNHTPKPFI